MQHHLFIYKLFSMEFVNNINSAWRFYLKSIKHGVSI
jgi:hypothetical protein